MSNQKKFPNFIQESEFDWSLTTNPRKIWRQYATTHIGKLELLHRQQVSELSADDPHYPLLSHHDDPQLGRDTVHTRT